MAQSTKGSDQPAAAQIRAYLAGQPPKTRAALKKIRATVLAVAPGAAEAFTYRMPVVKLDGKVLVWYAGFKNHTSLFPIGDAIRAKYAAELEGYETSKGTVRLPLSKPVPVKLVKQLVKARLGELRRKK